MSELEKHLASRFDGSIEDARKIRKKCQKALEQMKEVESVFHEIGRDENMRIRRSLLKAAGDILFFGIQPIEAKYPDLKAED